MKAIFLNLLVTVIATSAFAKTPMAPVRSYDFETLKIDGESIENTESLITEGGLTLDLNAGEIHVFAQQVPNCDPNQMCPKFMINLLSTSAEIVDVTHTTCSTIYTAEKNLMPVDGFNTKIVFESFDNSPCVFAVRPTPTAEITVEGYDRLNGSGVHKTVYEMTF